MINRECERLLNLFEQSLEGLSEEVKNNYLDEIDLFLKTYLYRVEVDDIKEADQYFGDYFGYYLIRKCAWSRKNTIKQSVDSMKIFYKCLYDNNIIDKEKLDYVLFVLKENVDAWVRECDDFNNGTVPWFSK